MFVKSVGLIAGRPHFGAFEFVTYFVTAETTDDEVFTQRLQVPHLVRSAFWNVCTQLTKL